MPRFEDLENAGLRVVIGDDGIVQSILDSQGRNVGMTGGGSDAVTASRTLSFFDGGKYLICDSGAAIALTVPSDATTGWTGTVTIAACRKGVGAVTFAAGAGVTLRGDLATPAQYGSKGIVRIGTNEWTVIA